MKELFRNLLVNSYWDNPRNWGSVDDLIEELEEGGFFEAPCSTQYHLSKEGGLLEHSLNVEKIAVSLAESLNYENINSVKIVSLLHDVGKMGQFGKPNYIPNILASGKISDKKPFLTNGELISIPHEIRSIQIIGKYLDLSEDENFAIIQHNGMYGDLKYGLAGKETQLQMILHWSDMWASRVVEKGI